MAIVVTDKRFIDKDAPFATKVKEVPAPVEEKIPLVKIRPDTLQKCQSEAIRGWLFSVMPDQQAKAPSV